MPAMHGLNPYLPPQHDDPTPDLNVPWTLDGSSLLVRHLTSLPGVDLETGATDKPLVTVKRTYTKQSPTLTAIIFGLIAIFWALQAFTSSDFPLFYGLLLFAIIRPMLERFFKDRINIEYWIQRETGLERRDKIRNRIRVAVLVINIVIIFAVIFRFNTLLLDFFKYFLIGMFAPMFAILAWQYFDRSKLKPSPGPRGWVRLEKIHPEALGKLREMQASHATS